MNSEISSIKCLKKYISTKDTNNVIEKQTVRETSSPFDSLQDLAHRWFILWPIVLHQNHHVTKQRIQLGTIAGAMCR